MKVSVIVPVYNAEKYLEKCLNSLVNQTLNEIEIIIVNDGSTDDSQKIIDQFVQQYPTKIKSFIQKNAGQAVARNFGLKHITGECIGFVDSDDWVDEDMYEQLFHHMIDNDADIAVCDMVDNYPNKTIYHNSSDITNKFSVTPSACNKLFKATLVGDCDFPAGLWYEDFCFTTKLLLKTDKLVGVNKGYYHCHCLEESTMHNHNSVKNLDMLSVMTILKEYIDTLDQSEQYTDIFEFMLLHHVVITSINRVAIQKNEQKHMVISKMREYVKAYIPKLKSCKSYNQLPNNRKIIAWLNYNGLYHISKLLLGIKAKNGYTKNFV
ncbi:glycosyltransferase family 2 protein [Paludicola sp. MB14-C6]|uniref:glycosyltransferase family 2 protein n=1 Tax=Paludihabitans sp. MB14-C6 TaxID=3070656 RepID=UPI0027DDA371|nr:glycosyltransferase family 2 protein [Paludicola sp. MB14-C6]WMJ23076.1 glycosyltransferase family 2 protein [Paludicola sp. MB14-C6]